MLSVRTGHLSKRLTAEVVVICHVGRLSSSTAAAAVAIADVIVVSSIQRRALVYSAGVRPGAASVLTLAVAQAQFPVALESTTFSSSSAVAEAKVRAVPSVQRRALVHTTGVRPAAATVRTLAAARATLPVALERSASPAADAEVGAVPPVQGRALGHAAGVRPAAATVRTLAAARAAFPVAL